EQSADKPLAIYLKRRKVLRAPARLEAPIRFSGSRASPVRPRLSGRSPHVPHLAHPITLISRPRVDERQGRARSGKASARISLQIAPWNPRWKTEFRIFSQVTALRPDTYAGPLCGIPSLNCRKL